MCYSFQISWSSKKNLTPKVEDQKRLVQAYVRGMHGRGSQASAPASDAAGRRDAGGSPQTARSCRVVPRGDSRIGPMRLKSAPTRPKSAPTRSVLAVSAGIGRNGRSGRNSKKKKKKKVQNAPFDLT